MSSARIVADQAGKPAGQASLSRRDFDLAVPVYLSNASDEGVRSHRWRMVDRPSGSVAVITNKASAVAQFTPDVPGSYLVELQVDEAHEGQVDRRVYAVLTDFGGQSPRPLRIPASGEADEANWLYDFGVTTAPNRRGWMPDFVELILYAGVINGQVGTLHAVLTVGNTTGGEDILLSSGDALRGAPGAAANVIGGSGVNGFGVNIQGADSSGPNGNGGPVAIRSGNKAGVGTDGPLSVTGGEDAVITLGSTGDATVSTPNGKIALGSSGNIEETAGGDHEVLAQGNCTREALTGNITDTAAGSYVLGALSIGLTSAAGISLQAGTTMVAHSGTTMQIQAGSSLAVTAVTTATQTSASATRSTSSGGIVDTASTSIAQTAGTSATRTASAGNISDTASANASRTATAGSISDTAATAANRTVTAGSISDTATTAANRTVSAGSISDSASTSYQCTAASAASLTCSAGTTTIQATLGTVAVTGGTNVSLTAGVNTTLYATNDITLNAQQDVDVSAAATITTTSGGASTFGAGGAMTLSSASASRSTFSGNIADSAAGNHTTGGVDITRSASAAISDTAATTATTTAPTSVTLATPAVILSTGSSVLRGTDGATPTGFTVRGGSGSGGNTAGAALTVKSGDSVGSGSGTTLTLSPGAVVTGSRGRVLATHDGPDTDELLALSTTGTNGAAVDLLVGTQNPSAAAISASCGDLYHRDTGSLGEKYIKSAGNGNTSGWHKVGNTTLFARSTVGQTVSGTLTETTIVNVTVPGGAMGSNGTLRVHAQGTMVATTVSSTVTIRIKFGGTTIYQDVTPTLVAGNAARAWVIDVTLVNTNNTSSQAGGGRVSISAPTVATTGVGALATADTGGAVRLGTAAIDTTSDQSFLITVEHSSNSAGTSTVRTTATSVLSLH